MMDRAGRPADRHIHGLDLLRFFAAVLVLLNHFATYGVNRVAVVGATEPRAYDFLAIFEGTGAIGVQIFFVISGFVIAMSAGSLTGKPGALRFAVARAIRIFPGLWISGVISVIALSIAGFDFLPLLARFLRSAVLSPIGPYIDGVVWSLVVEAVFYALIAIFIIFFKKIPLVKIAILIGISSASYIFALFAVSHYGYAEAEEIMSRFWFKISLLRHGVFFAIGMIIRAGSETGFNFARVSLVAIFSTAGIVEISLADYAQDFHMVLAVIIWCAAMLWLVISVKGWVAFHDLHGVYRYIGHLSYPLYLNHYTTGMVIVYLLGVGGVSGLPSFIISISCVILISCFVLLCERWVGLHLRNASWRLFRNPALSHQKG